MSKWSLTLTGGLLAAGLSGQVRILPVDHDHRAGFTPVSEPVLMRNHALIAEGAFDYSANSLLNELPAALWRGIFLNRELRGRSRDGLRSANRLGYALEVRLTHLGEAQGRWRPSLSIAHHELLGARFPADLYNLTFFGNAAYEERRADLGPTAIMRMRYQTIGAGAQDTRTSSHFRVDLVIGQSHDAVDIRWADLYTGADGRVLRARIAGDYHRSDTAEAALGVLNGLGLAVSGRWDVPIARNPNRVRLELEARDLGFCAWGRKGQRLDRDTTLTFDGITVDNILDLDGTVIGEEELLDTLGVRFRTTGYSTWLPFQLIARLSAPLGERWMGSIALDQRNLPGYHPHLELSARRLLSERAEAGIEMRMGGFGGLRVGASAAIRPSNRLLITIATPHLPAFLTGRTRGAGLFINAVVGF
jgi:hypothetical protein